MAVIRIALERYSSKKQTLKVDRRDVQWPDAMRFHIKARDKIIPYP